MCVLRSDGRSGRRQVDLCHAHGSGCGREDPVNGSRRASFPVRTTATRPRDRSATAGTSLAVHPAGRDFTTCQRRGSVTSPTGWPRSTPNCRRAPRSPASTRSPNGSASGVRRREPRCRRLQRRMLVRRIKGGGTYTAKRIDYMISADRAPSWSRTVRDAGPCRAASCCRATRSTSRTTSRCISAGLRTRPATGSRRARTGTRTSTVMARSHDERSGGLATRFVPILQWLPRYERSWLSRDAIASVSVWALLVPQALAYSSIAGVPVQYGLYTAFAALLGYALFGTSKHMVQGPSAAVAAVVAAVIRPLSAPQRWEPMTPRSSRPRWRSRPASCTWHSALRAWDGSRTSCPRR